MSMPQDYDISVIIVSYNCLDSLKACIESLEGQQRVRLEMVVIDNDSSDGTAPFLEKRSLKHILSQKNLGFGAAVNRAAERAEGKFLFILNPDTIVPPLTLFKLLEYAGQDPQAGIVAPLLLRPDGRQQLSARRMPRRRDIMLGRGSPLHLFGLVAEDAAGYIINSGDDPMEVPAVSAGAILIEAALFRKLGGFDERFFLYMEDLDLCKRISRVNKKTVILPSVSVIHVWRQSSRQRPYFSSYHHHLSVYKYFVKHYPTQLPHNLLLLIALIAGLSITFVLNLLRPRGQE